MLHNAFPHFVGKVQAIEPCIPALQLINDPQCMPVMLERTSELAHLAVQFPLTNMRERRMAEVVSERKRLCVLLVQFECSTYRPGNLGDFNRVGQPIAKMVAKAGRENLCLAFQAAKRA